MPKTLTPEDIKLHVTDIFNFAKEGKTCAEIQKHNWRFRSIKNVLIKKQIILTHYKINSKKTYYKSNVLKSSEHHFLQILKEFQIDIKIQNEKLVDNFIKKDRTKQLGLDEKPETKSEYEKEIKELEFKLNIERTANSSYKKRINEAERGINENIKKLLSKLEALKEEILEKDSIISDLTNKIEVKDKDLETSEKLELESKFKKQVEEHAKRFDELVKERNNYISEYSNYINEKLVEIADLKNKLLKENKIVCYKIFGITIFKVTTNKRN